jgi:3-mercaptopyruvate sulfurtransferase SseA
MRPPFRLIFVALAATVLPTASLATPSAAQANAAARAAPSDAIVTPSWLAARLNDPTVVVLHVSHDDYAAGHVPGARNLEYGELVTQRGTLGSELPDAASARRLFESLGVSGNSTVVVSAHQAPMATRALFTLASIGGERMVDGSYQDWSQRGLPTVP